MAVCVLPSPPRPLIACVAPFFANASCKSLRICSRPVKRDCVEGRFVNDAAKKSWLALFGCKRLQLTHLAQHAHLAKLGFQMLWLVGETTIKIFVAFFQF